MSFDQKEYDKKRYLNNKEKILEQKKQHYLNNKEKILEKAKQYHLDNKEQKKQYNKQYHLYNKEKIKQYRLDNKEKILEQQKQYYLNNKEKLKQWRLDNKEKDKQWRLNNKERINKLLKQKRNTNALYKLTCNLRSRIKDAIKRKSWYKNNSTPEILGCDFETVKKHLENQFIDGMSWDNHGRWHIDHIKPLAKATTQEELYKLCHYTNLQPLWAADNLSKGAKEL